MTKIAVILFPGTNCELDTTEALNNLGADARIVWHSDSNLDGFDGVVLPGGFAHGDYLRTGAIARFSPVMKSVAEMAEAGRPVLGICNGFQILCEGDLLPGGFIANRDLSFLCKWVDLEVADQGTMLTAGLQPGSHLRLPLNSYQGNFVAGASEARVVLTYQENVNGSDRAAAAVANETGNVVGVMPHPERASADWLGSVDGNLLLDSFLQAAAA
ncbi:MAG TPA: phosphoribosylformylglycinamidine synthase subunit PurQ [Acidimicrobiia bacterium]|nr:phosphoribosylformylglycinamidine synthase subunit PurQ [Acidimicrobiia bacterium]